MTFGPLELGLLIATGAVAGALGALLGIGGGIFVVPVLVLGFHEPAQVAVAASLAAVVATSSTASSVYVERGLTNMRLGLTLELATTAGAISGGLTAAVIPEDAVLWTFAGFAGFVAVLMLRREPRKGAGSRRTGREGGEDVGRLGGVTRDPVTGETRTYSVGRVPLGLGASFVAGNVSGLLGVGGGILKVPVMSIAMGVPLRVAAATSNLMIGATAAASLVIYLQRGFLFPLVAAPVALGVTAGALLGTRLSGRFRAAALARTFGVVLLVVAAQMALDASGVWRG
ncbi:MAG TPA: sulfite exporter TauE/SafE family protein [Actinomycetota bacterium]